MCEYCEEKEGFTPLSNTSEYSGLEISMNRNWIRCRAYMGKEIFVTQDVVSIKYCPMCGKKLEE